MSHGHQHDHSRGADSRALVLVLALTATFTVAEVVGGLVTGSLALLADAGHMLSDSTSLALALGALWLARRPPSPRMSFGLRRTEIMAALVNGVTLVAVALWIFIEAARRLQDPPEVSGQGALLVAVLGVMINIAGAAILWRSRAGSLNMRAAFLHVLADLLGSVGVIVAAILILTTGWLYADPLVSIVIGVLILGSSWRVLRESVTILLEAAPADVDPEEVGRRLARAPGVIEVHDLHIWTITSGFPALSAHVTVGRDEDCHARRGELAELLKEEFGIVHTTLQVGHGGPLQVRDSRAPVAPRGEPSSAW